MVKFFGGLFILRSNFYYKIFVWLLFIRLRYTYFGDRLIWYNNSIVCRVSDWVVYFTYWSFNVI